MYIKWIKYWKLSNFVKIIIIDKMVDRESLLCDESRETPIGLGNNNPEIASNRSFSATEETAEGRIKNNNFKLFPLRWLGLMILGHSLQTDTTPETIFLMCMSM